MELRSGRILQPVTFKRKVDRRAITNVVKMMENLSIEEKDQRVEAEIMGDLKIFFRFLFYQCCEDLGNKVRLMDIERTQGRKPNFYELMNWKADNFFWLTTFQEALRSMRLKLPLPLLLEAFDVFMKFEHVPQNPQSDFAMRSALEKYLLEFYENSSSDKMIQLMEEIKQVKSHPFSVTDRKIYLQELACDLASQTTNPWFNDHPNIISWDVFFQYSKSRCCYIPEVNGGRTVRKLPSFVCNFSMFSSPMYQYKILRTGETFRSPEKDIRKAFLLHQRLTEKH